MAKETEQEVTPKVETDEKVETPPEVSKEDLQKQVVAKEEEVRKLQQTVSRHAESERKLKDQSETLASLHKRLDQQEASQADILDYLEEIRGEPAVEKPKTQTHREQLETQRKERETSPKKEVDPDVMKFVTYVDSQSLSIEDDLVKEAVGEDRNPKDALKYLRDKVKASQGQDVDKRAKEIAEDLLEQKLKEYGLTASGAGGPTAGGGLPETARGKIRAGWDEIHKD